ncbi:hypothetical protein C8J56DRAFT_901169 [Mycena floridula]|nr:hypothetical protein C8J56DRAFT_901169 [Mycena floridula]
MVIRGVRGTMLFHSRSPTGNRLSCPSSLDLVFLYLCSYIAATPGQYLALLSSENYGIAKGPVAQKRFHLTNFDDYNAVNIAKFFTNQGKFPCDINDGFIWSLAFAKRMAFETSILSKQANLFFTLHKDGARLEAMGLAPPGFPSGPQGNPKKPTEVKLPKSTAGISQARPTKQCNVATSQELTLATSNALSLNNTASSDMVDIEEMNVDSKEEIVLKMDTSTDFVASQLTGIPGVAIDAPSFPVGPSPSPATFTFGTVSPIYSLEMFKPVTIPENFGIDPKSIMPVPQGNQNEILGRLELRYFNRMLRSIEGLITVSLACLLLENAMSTIKLFAEAFLNNLLHGHFSDARLNNYSW